MGGFYTWFNKRVGSEIILERPDRFFANFRQRSVFPLAFAESLDFFGSDHRAILLNLEEMTSGVVWHKRFTSEHVWARHEGFADFLRSTWREVTMGTSAMMTLKLLRPRRKRKFSEF